MLSDYSSIYQRKSRQIEMRNFVVLVQLILRSKLFRLSWILINKYANTVWYHWCKHYKHCMCLAMNWLHFIRYRIKEEIVPNCDASTIKEVRFVDFSAMSECIFPKPLPGFERTLSKDDRRSKIYNRHDNSNTNFR